MKPHRLACALAIARPGIGGCVLIAGLVAGLSAAEAGDDSRQRAMELAAQGHAERAYEILVPWVELHPEDVEAASVLALVASQTGRVDEAEVLLDALPTHDARLALLSADIALQRGQARVAIGRLAQHRRDHPSTLDREFARILGQAFVETGRPEEALEVLADVQGDPLLALWKGRALFYTGRMEEATDVLRPFAEQIIRAGVRNAPISQLFLMSEILSDFARDLVALGHAGEAVALLEASVEDLASRRAWSVMAQALVAAGRGDEARVALNRGAKLVPRKGE